MVPDKAHLKVLQAINNLSLKLGKKLLSEFLLGDATARVMKLNLHKNPYFGSLDKLTEKEVSEILEIMKYNGLIEKQSLISNKFIKIFKITKKGEEELKNPSIMLNKKGIHKYFNNIEEITDIDKIKFEQMDFFLNKFNNEQKKAIISDSKKILCIAGAGSGKTSVLIKRIEFLIKYKSISQEKILAITFTRKAKQEMQTRLSKIFPDHKINIQTFNSFSERIIRKYEKQIYPEKSHVITNALKMKLFNKALKAIRSSPEEAINIYFDSKKIKLKDKSSLLFSLVNDVFTVFDYYNNKKESVEEIKKLIDDLSLKDKRKGIFLYKIVIAIKALKEKNNLRDFTEQIVKTIEFFDENVEAIPKYDHVLIDEYQDINDLQIDLIDYLNSKNLFVVGDPRQSIYGWRNAKIEYILGFNSKYPDASILQLTKNYRSTKEIITIANEVIKPMNLPEIEAVNSSQNNSVLVINHPSEDAECMFLVQSVLAQNMKRNEIFILARTNKQLDVISKYFDKHKIKYLKKSNDLENSNRIPNKDEVVLSTVHAIKGLEAELVYVVGANSFNYPCKVSDHPVLELIKAEDNYQKDREELRLFYVALTRAKSRLVISYYANITKFIPRHYLEENFPFALKNKSLNIFFERKKLYDELREWRRETAKLYHCSANEILSDRLLLHISKIKPGDFAELEAIPGMSTTKLNKFGDDILDLING